MQNREEIEKMQERIRYLEDKVTFLRAYAEELVESGSRVAPVNIVVRDEAVVAEANRLAESNRQLEQRLSALRNSVSWRITAPIRKFNVPFIDRMFGVGR